MIADGFRGNDLVVRHDGSLYVTNPGWNGTDPSQVWYVSPRGEKKVVDTGLSFPMDCACLQISHCSMWPTAGRTGVFSYQIQPDGSLAHKQRYFHLCPIRPRTVVPTESG